MDNPLVQPDPGLFIWTILTFLVLLTLLAKFAWRPLLQALDSRQERSGSRSTMRSRPSRSWSGCTRSRRRSSARRASRPSDHHAEPSRRRAAAGGDEAEGQAEADGIVRNAERQIQLETSRALQQIRHEAVDLSVMIASKIIQRNLTKEDNETADRRGAEAGRSASPLSRGPGGPCMDRPVPNRPTFAIHASWIPRDQYLEFASGPLQFRRRRIR